MARKLVLSTIVLKLKFSIKKPTGAVKRTNAIEMKDEIIDEIVARYFDEILERESIG
ncbi:MAG: hypothetical protein Fur0024_0380 [Patescibacteria group bacterium]